MKNTLEAKLAYRENAVRGATPIELVVILFDAAIDDMRRAVTAIKTSDIEERATAVRHAMLVLQQLQGTLDFEKGGQVARQFEQFYNLIRAKVLESQLRNSPEMMQQQIHFMSEVRDCWVEAEKQLKPKPLPHPSMAAPLPAGGVLEDGGSTAEWNA
jgi:flagellar secretion chaperone FliS